MLLIIGHHYVVHSGLLELIQTHDTSLLKKATITLFGAWGKTGIDCFVVITAWFMNSKEYKIDKFFDLLYQILFYSIFIYFIFYSIGEDKFILKDFFWEIFPFHSLSNHFISCFLIFYLLIPILNVIVKKTDKTIFKRILIILLILYSIFPYFPRFEISYNYVSWFCVIYLLIGYIRKYDILKNITHRQWGIYTLGLFVISSLSIFFINFFFIKGYIGFAPYYFVQDSNKFLPLALGISSFMYFKGIKIKNIKFINLIGSSVFGVLLIHDNWHIRNWIWKGPVDCLGNLNNGTLEMLLIMILSVVLIFITCSFIEIGRKTLLENKINYLISLIVNGFKKGSKKILAG